MKPHLIKYATYWMRLSTGVDIYGSTSMITYTLYLSYNNYVKKKIIIINNLKYKIFKIIFTFISHHN
jgi:hypothetical protein